MTDINTKISNIGEQGETGDQLIEKLKKIAKGFEGGNELMKSKIEDLVTHIEENIDSKEASIIRTVIEGRFNTWTVDEKKAYNDAVKNIIVSHFALKGINVVA